MKKLYLFVVVLLFAASGLVKAEDQTKNYLPQAGDISIGFEGTPFLNYLGNAFNGTQDNTLNLGDNTLHFRYYFTDDTALRLALRANFLREVDKFYLDDFADQQLDPLSRKQVEDKRVHVTNHYEIKAGYLMFRGENRLRGFFGGDLFFGYENNRRMFEYGNQITELNQRPETVVNWVNGNTGNPATRPLEQQAGKLIHLGAGAVIGAEYYILPKVAVGTELGLVYGHTIITQAHDKTETFSGSSRIEEKFERDPSIADQYEIASVFPYTFGNLYFMISF